MTSERNRPVPPHRGNLEPEQKDSAALDAERCADLPCVVGIGASAGGLEALRAVLHEFDREAACAFVVAQHMSPNYRSMLAELLSRDTRIRVQEITDGVAPVAGTLYVTPPNYDVVLREGALRLIEPEERVGPKPSVDKLFASLAHELGDMCGGIILSGTGSDGSQGARAIKASGGFVVAQAPDTAKYDSMPRAAIETGVVDLVLPPDEIARRIPELMSNAPGVSEDGDAAGTEEEAFRAVLELLRHHTKVDFTRYKPNTLRRRVQRRMNATRAHDVGDYYQIIKSDPGEVQNLFQDMLISATAFFRDTEQFEALRKELRERLARRRDRSPVRVWSAGCATGEEAYSMAIAVAEILESLKLECSVQVFATDIDENAMQVARRGVYSRALLEDLPRDLVNKYFVPQENAYQIKKFIREMVVFSRHDLTRDPPFLRMDLISCRNVFIYLGQELQERVIKTFHYALAPKGVLFLGKSESIGGTKSFFRVLDPHAKLFERSNRAVDPGITFTSMQLSNSAHAEQRMLEGWRGSREATAELTALVKSFAPDSIVVDEDFLVREIYGAARRYVTFPEGSLSQVVDRLLLPSLKSKVMTVLHRARRSGETAVGMHFEAPGQEDCLVQPRVYPVSLHGEPRLVLSFEKLGRTQGEGGDSDLETREAEELQRELAATREHLQSVIEEQETSNEELQALNEELNSANEELQSTNEELETSNEELQSTNEELTTLNEELNIKSAELLEANIYLEAVQNAIRDPLLIVDRDLNVVGFNTAAGRSLRVEQDHLRRNVRLIPAAGPLDAAFDLIERCLREQKKQVHQVQTGETDFEIRCDPIFNHRRELDGAVVSFIDNTFLAGSLRRIEASEARLAALFENTPALVTVKDLSGRYTYANNRFRSALGPHEAEVVGKCDVDLFDRARADYMRAKDQDVVRSLESRYDEDHFESPSGPRVFLSSRFPLLGEAGAESICCVSIDVTETVEARRRLELVTEVISASSQAVIILERSQPEADAADYLTRFVSASVQSVLGAEPTRLVGRSLDEVWRSCFGTAAAGAVRQRDEILAGADCVEIHVQEDGEPRWFEVRATFYARTGADPSRHLCLMVVDITHRKRSERLLRQKQEEVLKAAKLASLGEMAAGIAHELNTPLNTIQSYVDLLNRPNTGADLTRSAVVGIEDTVHQMSEIVTGLRSIARVESGGELRPCELIGMLNEIIRLCDLQMRNKGIPIEVTTPVEEIHIDCLPTQIGQVFVNLLNNAVDAVRGLEEKWIRVEVIDGEDTVRVRVIDSGDGIPDKIAAMVMTPFFTTKDEGTGLGLSLSNSLLQAHGGELLIDPTCPNTCFEVVLPKRGKSG